MNGNTKMRNYAEGKKYKKCYHRKLLFLDLEVTGPCLVFNMNTVTGNSLLD